MANILLERLSRSSSVQTSKEFLIDEHYKLDSIKRFVYLSFTYAAANYNFDLFSKVSDNVTLVHFFFIELSVGMTYMVMDFFIKQYTGKLDFCKSLNPLLKGLHYGMLLQTALWVVINANDLADALQYFFSSLSDIPPWSRCVNIEAGKKCSTITDLVIRCQRNIKTDLDATSVHIYYNKQFINVDRSSVTVRLFVIALVWIANFFLSTASSTTLLKFIKLATTIKIVTTILCSTLLMLVVKHLVPSAFSELMRLDSPGAFDQSLNHVAVIYGIGLIGVYDHGTMSPYTTIDNAAVIFVLLYTVTGIMRSMIALSTLTMAKLLHSEFRSVKILYMIGVICFLGFGLTVPVTYYMEYMNIMRSSVLTNQFFLGAFKTAIIMWLYGVQKFATDIQFWLGFMPTKFYVLCWILLPIILLYRFVSKVMDDLKRTSELSVVIGLSWNLFVIIFVGLFHLRTITNYMVKSNLVAAFKSSSKYGPPDPEERKRRKKYNVTMNLRQCEHNCIMLDDRFDCNHAPVSYHPTGAVIDDGEELQAAGETSLTNIYLSTTNRRTRTSSIIDIQSLHYD